MAHFVLKCHFACLRPGSLILVTVSCITGSSSGSDHLRYVSVSGVNMAEELFVEAETQSYLALSDFENNKEKKTLVKFVSHFCLQMMDSPRPWHTPQ